MPKKKKHKEHTCQPKMFHRYQIQTFQVLPCLKKTKKGWVAEILQPIQQRPELYASLDAAMAAARDWCSKGKRYSADIWERHPGKKPTLVKYLGFLPRESRWGERIPKVIAQEFMRVDYNRPSTKPAIVEYD